MSDTSDEQCPFHGYTQWRYDELHRGNVPDVPAERCSLAAGHQGGHVNDEGQELPFEDVATG